METPCDFSLAIPDDFAPVDAQGVDSCVLRFEGDVCELYGGYGAFGNSLTDRQGSDEVRTIVDVAGSTGMLVSARRGAGEHPDSRPYYGGLYLPLESSTGFGLSASLDLHCETEAARAALLPVLGSIRF